MSNKSGFLCPHCNLGFAIDGNSFRRYFMLFEGVLDDKYVDIFAETEATSFILEIWKCPNCNKLTIKTTGYSNELSGLVLDVFPNSSAIQFPDYIPIAIRNDYEEACAILKLSPKASATLSRRCLQGMIRDFWEVKDKHKLSDEINAIRESIPAMQWKAIDAIRKIGNIGAHMEKDVNLIVDVEPEEANKLVLLIEMLLKDWYVNRHEHELLYNEIVSIDQDMQAERKNNPIKS